MDDSEANAVDPRILAIMTQMKELWPEKRVEYASGCLTISPWGDEVEGPVNFHLAADALKSECHIDDETHQAIWPDRSKSEAGVFWFWTKMNELLGNFQIVGAVHVTSSPLGYQVQGNEVSDKPKLHLFSTQGRVEPHAPNLEAHPPQNDN